MKKALSLFLSLLFLLSLASVAIADEATTEYNWVDVKDTIHEVFHEHINFWLIGEVDTMICLPDIFLSIELTEEDISNGTIAFFWEEESGAFVILTYSELSDLNLDSLFAYYSQNGYDVKMVSVNGIPAILEKNTEGNTLTLTFYTRDNMFFQVISSPLDEDSVQLYELVFSSIQPSIKDDAAEPPAPVNPVSSLISK